MARYLYSELASAITAWKNCTESKNAEWESKWSTYIDMLSEHLPSGSGIDTGTKIDYTRSHAERLVLNLSYHHMDECGGYDGWTTHTVTVTPSFARGVNLRISGRDRNQIKDYLADAYQQALNQDVTLTWFRFHFDDLIPEIKHKWIDSCTMEWSIDLDGVRITDSRQVVERELIAWCNQNESRLRACLKTA